MVEPIVATVVASSIIALAAWIWRRLTARRVVNSTMDIPPGVDAGQVAWAYPSNPRQRVRTGLLGRAEWHLHKRDEHMVLVWKQADP